jgi:hypothetical protein
VTGTIENPQVIESIVEVSIVGPKEFGIQARMPKDFQTRIQKHHADRRKNGHGTPPALWVDWIELEGPIQDGAVQTFRVEPEETVNVESAKWMKRLEENHQRYLGWKAGVDKAALAPENQQALEQIRKKYNITDLTNSIRLYQNADLLKGVHPMQGILDLRIPMMHRSLSGVVMTACMPTRNTMLNFPSATVVPT